MKDKDLLAMYEEMRSLEAEVRAAKRARKTSLWPGLYSPPAEYRPQHVLLAHAKQLTRIYATIAHSRGRVHKQGMTLEDQAKMLGLAVPQPQALPLGA